MAEFRKLELEPNMAVTEEVARREQDKLSSILQRVDKGISDEVVKTGRPVVGERPQVGYARSTNGAPTAEEHRSLTTEMHLLNGLYAAKLVNSDQAFDLADVQMMHELRAMAQLITNRRHGRSA